MLATHYDEGALLRRATTSYRSLFAHLVQAVQPLSMLPWHRTSLQPVSLSVASASTLSRFALIPTRIPSDSRVPKSSSIPSRLATTVVGNQPKSDSVDAGLARMAIVTAVVNVTPSNPSRIPKLVVVKSAASLHNIHKTTATPATIGDKPSQLPVHKAR